MTAREVTVIPVPGPNAEDVLVATSGPDEGSVFTGTEDGALWRVSADGSRVEQVARTGGRPLGIEQGPDGRLVVCDSERGLLRVDPAAGSVETVLDSVGGTRMRFCNNAAVADDGTIWFSDSSLHYGFHHWREDFVQHTRTGRLLRLAPGETEAEVVLDGLAFANGVALASDGSFVAVAETGGRTVVRHWLTGDRAGQRDLLVEDLPGYPDNISRGSDGLIWVALASPRDPLVDRLQRSPLWVRRAATRVPERLQPAVKHTARVQAYDDRGTLVHDLDLPADRYFGVTGVREHDGRVWLGSFIQPAVAHVDL